MIVISLSYLTLGLTLLEVDARLLVYYALQRTPYLFYMVLRIILLFIKFIKLFTLLNELGDFIRYNLS